MGLLDGLLREQAVGLLDGAQGALGVLRYARQHPLALRLDAPAAVGLLCRPRVIELEPSVQALRGLRVDRPDGVEQLCARPSARAARCPGWLRRRASAWSRRSARPGRRAGPAPRPARGSLSSTRRSLPRSNRRARKRVSAARAPAAVIDRQPERDLPAQIPGHRLHRLLVGEAGAVLEQQQLGQLRRRNRRSGPRRLRSSQRSPRRARSARRARPTEQRTNPPATDRSARPHRRNQPVPSSSRA